MDGQIPGFDYVGSVRGKSLGGVARRHIGKQSHKPMGHRRKASSQSKVTVQRYADEIRDLLDWIEKSDIQETGELIRHGQPMACGYLNLKIAINVNQKKSIKRI